MADNYTFTEGSGRTARSVDGSALIPYMGALTAVPAATQAFRNYTYASGIATSLPSAPAGYTHAVMSVGSAGELRYRPDATNPNASVGHLLTAGVVVEFANLPNVRVVSITGSVPVDVTYSRYDFS